MILLKQSTAATLRVGPFMDATDAVTPETGITLGAADQAELLKHSGATVDISGATWAAITGVAGYYDLSLTTSHTDTLGMLTVVVQDASVCIPAPAVRAMVIPAAVYDSLVGGTDTLPVDAIQWNGAAVATPATAGHPVVTMKVGTGTGEINLSSGRVPLQSGVQRNVALRFPFIMKDTTGAPLTGSTVTVTYSHDGGSFTSVGSATEIASGFYYIDLSGTIMNNEQVMLRMSGSGGSGTPADNAALLLTDP